MTKTLNMKTRLINDNELSFLKSRCNDELTAQQFYLQLGAIMESNGYLGFAKYFYDSASEEKEHANKVIEYANKLGATITVSSEPIKINKVTPLEAFKMAFELENNLRKNYAIELTNINLFPLVKEMLEIQTDAVGEVGDIIAQFEAYGNNFILIDQQMLK